MRINRLKRQIYNVALSLAGVAVLLGILFVWEDYIAPLLGEVPSHKLTRQEQGEVFGMMPKPTQQNMMDPVTAPFKPKPKAKVVIKRIPRISKGMTMPHPYWGECVRCHLYKGVKAGGQWKSPVGKALEAVSTIIKVGPPITPDSTRPHPPAGRCIKCHDIVIMG